MRNHRLRASVTLAVTLPRSWRSPGCQHLLGDWWFLGEQRRVPESATLTWHCQVFPRGATKSSRINNATLTLSIFIVLFIQNTSLLLSLQMNNFIRLSPLMTLSVDLYLLYVEKTGRVCFNMSHNSWHFNLILSVINLLSYFSSRISIFYQYHLKSICCKWSANWYSLSYLP